MRLHHLQITGFGPFADTVRIDFDVLSDAGLFLLTGPTGAGKSSILDAVCFALYGDIPGDRSTAKRLRSDQAADDVVPRVVLEVTMAGRRFRIDRSPSWQRPKKRGVGLTTEQARVVISERRPTGADDATTQWHPLSTRLDETGHLVTRLLGLNLPQFCQVAMLPQGRFQAFLRAKSEERHALLQQVFQTGRFDQVERWLRERRVALRRASEAQHAFVADLVSRVSEVAGSPPPADWGDEPGSLRTWHLGLTDNTERARVVAVTQVDAAAALEADTGAAATAGIELAGLIATHASATRSLAALEAAAPAHRRDVARLDAARRAVGVRPLHEVAAHARAVVASTEESLRSSRECLTELLGPEADAVSPAEAHRDAANLLTDIARVRPLRDQAAGLERERQAATTLLEDGRAELDDVASRLADLPDVLVGLRHDLDVARTAVARAETLEASLVVWTARVDAAERAAAGSLSLVRAHESLREVAEQRLRAREDLVEIRERRLDGMAAEIAGQLAVGGCCPVCGSAEHPSPATPTAGAPDDAAERTARKRVDDLEAVVEAHTQQVRGLETQVAAATATAAGTLDEVSAGRTAVTIELEAARAEASDAQALETEVGRVDDEISRLSRRRDLIAAGLAERERTLAVLAIRVASLRDEVDAVLAKGGQADLDTLARHTQQVESAASRCVEAAREVERGRHDLQQAAARAEAAALEAGFESASHAAAAWIHPTALAALEGAIEQHRRDVARAHDTLADPEVAGAAAATAPDLEALAHAQHAARAAVGAAQRRRDALVEQHDRLTGLGAELDNSLAVWEPTRADLDVVAGLASFVEGKHPDNRLQMRLSAYVLAHRLGQVVAAANLRLASMSDHRYSLVHTGRRGAGETRGGLSLLVRDDWSGETRDPATLSGGETFFVSLALALGLADVITDEVGGADLDTIFVDEGFGSLDADTLEDVMDTLDTLRDGGRVVGVVSHVLELQTRIPTQLRVHKERHGSRTSVRLG